MDQINKLGIFTSREKKRSRYFTKSIYRDFSFFDESIVKKGSDVFREVSPNRSKFVAAIAKGLSQSGISQGKSILYLGASHGYTPSFISDIVGSDGEMFCVEFAPIVARDLVLVCEKRANMIPIIADASHPELYSKPIGEVDVVFQDIAQREQVGIFLKNCDVCLKSGGFGLLSLKARSVDVTKNPKQIFTSVRAELQKHMVIVDYRELSPFEKDHAFFVVKKK